MTQLELTKKEIDIICTSLKLYVRMAETTLKNGNNNFLKEQDVITVVSSLNTIGLLLKKINK
jgi:hypothetical protein